MTIKLLYLTNSAWEKDFLIYDILHNIKDKIELIDYNYENMHRIENDESIVNNNIFVVNHAITFEDALRVVSKIKPLIIFHFSDEEGDKPNWLLLRQHTNLLFRQYNHVKYINPFPDIVQIPLGYVDNFLSKKYSLDLVNKKINERELNASFVGCFKSDREYMCLKFKENFENVNIINCCNDWNLNNLQIKPPDLFNIYSNSKFVIIGRGNISLDCFRIYEAVVAGAIPVIAGPIEEIKNTFFYNNNLPPFIFAESWEEAVILCKNLLNDDDKMQYLQNDILQWWKSQITNINSLVETIINNKLNNKENKLLL
jgi:hypothetical protein